MASDQKKNISNIAKSYRTTIDIADFFASRYSSTSLKFDFEYNDIRKKYTSLEQEYRLGWSSSSEYDYQKEQIDNEAERARIITWLGEGWLKIQAPVDLSVCEDEEEQLLFTEFWGWFGANIEDEYKLAKFQMVEYNSSPPNKIKAIHSEFDIGTWYIRFENPNDSVLYKLTWFADEQSD